MFNSQLNTLKWGMKNDVQVTLNFSPKVIGNCNDETNFLHKFLLTNTQISRLRKAVANNSPANIKLSKAQLHKMGQSGRFLGRLLGQWLKAGLPVTKNGLKLLAKSVLIPLGLTAAATATDAAIQKKIFGSGMTTLIISNEEMDDIMKIIKSLEEFSLLTKGVSKTTEDKAKEQKDEFRGLLLGKLGASLLGNILKGKKSN